MFYFECHTLIRFEGDLSVWIPLGPLYFVKLIKCESDTTYNLIFSLKLNRLFYIYGLGSALFLDWLFTPGTDLCLHSAVWVVGLSLCRTLCCRLVEWKRAVWVGRSRVLEWRESHRWRDERVAPHCCNCCAMIWLIQSMLLSLNPASIFPCSADKLTCLHSDNIAFQFIIKTQKIQDAQWCFFSVFL